MARSKTNLEIFVDNSALSTKLLLDRNLDLAKKYRNYSILFYRLHCWIDHPKLLDKLSLLILFKKLRHK